MAPVVISWPIASAGHVVKLTDALGRNVHRGIQQRDRAELDVGALANGAYSVRVTTDRGTLIALPKVIIAHR